MNQVQQQFETARKYLAGGVTSSTRVNQAIGHPLYIDRAHGCRVWDLDGREYIDFCCSHGATLLGHGDPRVAAAIERAMSRGFPCSYENEQHAELAQRWCETIPCLERVRMVGSGTEATSHCIRLARAFTGRPKILKFEGNFHGYHDQVMFSIGAPLEALGPENTPLCPPGSTGITLDIERQLVIAPYNRADLLEEAVARYRHELAAVMCEPIYYNSGCVRPLPEFLDALRRVTTENGILLIFDEVLCAYRMAPGGAQEYLSITPDLCTLGKAVGGGLPLSAFGGRADVMRKLMPEGDCQHSGTYNGHPLVVAAGIAANEIIRAPGYYDHINALGTKLFSGLNAIFARRGVPGRVQGLGARFGIYFGIDAEVRSYRDAAKHDRALMLKFIRAAIDHGVYFHDYGGAACHHGFCSAMTLADMDEALERLDAATATLS
jgi:glutamate-1-semialdehyde 2,1-aminomutase